MKLPKPTQFLAIIALKKPCPNCDSIHGKYYTKERIYCSECNKKITQ